MKETLSVRFLYGTALGRLILKLLVRPGLSKVVGSFLDCRLSKAFIAGFKKSNNISLDNIIVPDGGFPSFNSFFSRKRAFLHIDEESDHLVSPCDAFLSYVDIDSRSSFEIKNSIYSLSDLLNDEELTKDFSGGIALIFRLTPSHYHRYVYVDEGNISLNKKINGELHCVRPLALEKYPVYIRNTREYSVIETKHFGRMIQMEVGALMVGRISNFNLTDVSRGIERGNFEFGGSTIVLLFEKNSIELCDDIKKGIADNGEYEVTLGDHIGSKI